MLHALGVNLRTFLYKLFKRRTLGVVGLILNKDEVCLVRHSYGGGWYLPGGSIDRNETPYDALVREVYEETGVRVQAATLMNVYSYFSGGWSNYVLCYLIQNFAVDTAATLDPEIAEARFFSLNGLPDDIRPTAKRRIEEVVKNCIPTNPSW